MELPSWMKTSETERRARNGRMKKRIHVEVDADLAYSAFFVELEIRREKIKEWVEDERNRVAEEKKAGLTPEPGYEPDAFDVQVLKFDQTRLDRYWLEIIYQCIKMDCQRFNGFGIYIRIRDTARKYAQVNYPKGRGAEAATKGKEAKGYYRRLRGSLP